jgi:hypothetical protein
VAPNTSLELTMAAGGYRARRTGWTQDVESWQLSSQPLGSDGWPPRVAAFGEV